MVEKRKFKFILFIMLLFWGTQLSYACDCDSQGSFLTVASKTEFVSLVKIKKYLTFKKIYTEKIPTSMEVEIIQIFKGKETRKKIIVWGDNGNLCRPYLSKFRVNKHYVIAFYSGIKGSDDFGHKGEKNNDYFISSCGEYWLDADINERNAQGLVLNDKKSISFKELDVFFDKN
ncbi:hypothetical protein HNP38_001240 [Chryseobacterium defluvii]|uniref:Tissue inhibitor of metalloproteinase n=1 Tax=Chryseobacterium defluvii TaxID=160396 RepID=A0A840KD94_9FLAO|nr:hypothetical protein [Chryseobacterium defluvii]MBB4805968.1 hypothetical protein [Chryseobacterium defluvii]